MVKSYSILPVAKTFNQRMRKFRTLLSLHAPWLLYVCFASWKKPGSVLFKVSFYNLESGKRNIILLEKSPYEPCLSNKTDDALVLPSSLHLFSVCGSLKLLYETQKGKKSK